MNNVQRAIVRTQKFVADHKVVLTATTTAAVTAAACGKVLHTVVKQRDEFLADNGLLEKFYATLTEEI
jgi:hypothetical protein